MIPVLDTDEMREADRLTIEELGVPSLVLMEMAASAVTEGVVEHFGDAGRVVVVCGPGNNGGDGLAAARQLRCRGFEVEAVLLVAAEELRGDAAAQLDLARAFGVPLRACDAQDLSPLGDALASGDVVVDALFGTGLTRRLEGRMAEAVRRIGDAGLPVVAVDIPSGLFGSSSQVPGETVEAALTVTFAAPKVAHALPPACWRCGEVAVADIGIPPWVLSKLNRLALVETEDVGGWLPRRPVDSHKGYFGHLFVLAGSFGRAGAAAMAARAAVTMGAGLVTVGIPKRAVNAVQALVPEAMVEPLPDPGETADVGAALARALERATAVAVGPGLGTDARGRQTLDAVLDRWSGPILLDADALTLVAGRLEALAAREGPTVLTPHPGELGRILQRSTDQVVEDRLGAAREAAGRAAAVCLAKGARTLVVAPDGSGMINPTGSPGLASGGAGDVLTGTIGSLLAQGVPPLEAAAAGAFLHGRAAELASERHHGATPATVVIERLVDAEREARELA